MIGMMQKKRAENRSSNQNTHSPRDQFEARTDIELPIMNFPSSCDETTLSIMRNSRSPGASSGSGKRLRKDRVNDSTSGIQMKSFLFDADGSSQSHVPCLKGSMEEESASILSFSDSLCQRMGISGVNSCNSTRILGYVICALAIISLLTIVSLSRGNQHLLHPFSSASSSSPLSPEDIGSRITISAAAAAAFSSSHRAEDSNELNPISLDSESTTVMAEGKCSKFMGSMDEGAFSFKGIPYALPPTGNLRWRRPVAAASSTLDAPCPRKQMIRAKHFASECFQVNPFTKKYSGSEDCLYLNVWTPRLDQTAKLRVMVWIHGGFLQFGSSHQTGLSPSAKLAKKLDTVFVSLNYRLHALGFLSLNPVTNLEQGTDYRKTSINGTSKRSLGDERLTGNFGIWDQVMALTWVQQNIISFGGDPERVTVFGPDSTGATIMAMMSNQGVSQSLFQSAWIMDPAVFMNKSMDEVSRKAQDSFFLRSGCDSLSCLRSLSPESVTKIFLGNDDPSFRINDQNDLPIQGIFPQQLIVIDGDLVKSSLPSHVSQHLLIGSTSQAIEFWPGPSDLRSWDWDQYVKYVTTSLDSFGPRLSQLALRVYPPPASSSDASSTLVTAATTTTTSHASVSTSTHSQSEPSNFPSIPPPSVSPGHQDAMNSLGTRSESAVVRQMKNSGSGVRAMNESEASASAAAVRREGQEEDGGAAENAAVHHGEGSALLSEIDPTSKSMTTTEAEVVQASKAAAASSSMRRMGAELEAEVEKSVNSISPVSSLTNESMQGLRAGESDANSSQRRRRRSISSLADSISMRRRLKEEETGEQQAAALNPEFLYSTMVSDVRQTCPINKLSHLIKNSTTTASVHRYVITGVPSTSVQVYDYESKYSFHLWDAIAFFDQMDLFVKDAPTPEDLSFRDRIQEVGIKFSDGQLTELWSQVPQQVALIDSFGINRTTDGETSERCTFWQQQELLSYVWIS